MKGRLIVFGFALSLFTSAIWLPLLKSPSDDLVYCPLQKAWVERTPEKKVQRVLELDDICAAKVLKNSFLGSLAAVAKFQNDFDPDAVFWSFAERGEIDRSLPLPPGSPGLFTTGDRCFPAKGNQDTPDTELAEVIDAARLARPLSANGVLNIHRRNPTPLSGGTGPSQPRAPPLS